MATAIPTFKQNSKMSFLDGGCHAVVGIGRWQEAAVSVTLTSAQGENNGLK